MQQVLVKRTKRWSPTPWWKHLLMGTLAFLLAGMESYGELLAEADHELGARGIVDLTE